MLRYAIIVACLLSGIVQAAELWVDCNDTTDCYGKEPCYPKINSAINISDSGDLIWVVIGDYRENIVINKDNISLIGYMEGNEKPVIKGAGTETDGPSREIPLPDLRSGGKASPQRSSVLITGNSTKLKNFRIINDKRNGQVRNGISVISNGNLIENNDVSLYSYRGILINASSENKLISNSIFNNGEIGVQIVNANDDLISSENKLISNNISSNEGIGVQLVSANDNLVKCNHIKLNGVNIDIDTDSGFNLIHFNELIQREGKFNVIDRNGSNSWDKNYYYSGTYLCEGNSDGICSKPINLSGGSIIDLHPLSDPKLIICKSPEFCELVVEASANPNPARIGEEIHFRINISNEGLNGLNNINVSSEDPEIHLERDSLPFELKSGESWSFNASYTIKKDDLPGPFKAIFNAIGSSSMCRNRRWPSNPVSVDIIDYDISISKNVTPSSARMLTNVTFVINATNTGDITLKPVIVKDMLPIGLDYISDKRAGTISGRNISWILSKLDPGKSEYFELVAQINESASGILWNLVNATSQNPAGDNVTANGSASVEVIPSANISVTKTANPSSGCPLDNITFDINVTNTGKVPLDQVTIVDALPEGMEYINSTPAGNREGRDITWNLEEPLLVGKSKEIELVARIIQTEPGILKNTVNATGRPPSGPDVTNNSNETVEVLISCAKINATKTASPSSGCPLDNITFDINVTNTGKVPLDPVTVVDILPEGLEYLSSDRNETSNEGRNITWNLEDPLEPRESNHTRLVAQITQTSPGLLNNTVNATGRHQKGNVTRYDNETVEVLESCASISIEKSVSPSSGYPQTVVKFVIKVTNTGNQPLHPVIVKDALPKGLNFVDTTPEGTKDGQNISWILPQLDPGQSEYIKLLAQIDMFASGTLQNWVNVIGRSPIGINVTDIDSEPVEVIGCPSPESESACWNCCNECCKCPGNTTINLNNSGQGIQVVSIGSGGVRNLSQESKSLVE